MATTLIRDKKVIPVTKLHLDAELRLMRAVKVRKQARGEKITVASLRKRGYTEDFIKRFLAA